jgi:multidrug efflux pump subunit AcrA (membrane-fusion protein)
MTNRMFTSETLDSLLDELTDLALTSPNSATFFQSILNAAVSTTDAAAGAIWSVREVNYRLEAEVGLVQLGIGVDGQLQAIHEEALECATKKQSLNGTKELATRSYDSREYRFFGCRDQDLAYLVIELVHKEGAIAKSEEFSITNFMAALSEIAKDFRNVQLLQHLQTEDHLWSDFKLILPKLHTGIQLDETAYRIANEGRTFLQCDRLSVVQIEPNKSSIRAVSGVATIERRAKQVRTLESLVAVVAKSGQSYRYPSSELEAPQLSTVLQEYLDTSRAELVWIRLISNTEPDREPRTSSAQKIIGALVIENFSAESMPQLQHRCDLMSEHAAIAYRNAIEYSNMPLRRLSESLQGWLALYRTYRIKLFLTVAAGLTGLGLALVIPADLNIDARGTIQPVALRHLYAPANGEVVKVHFAHQSEVQAGNVLLEIRSRELELRKEELLTLHASAQEKLRGIEVSRLQNRKPNTSETVSSVELSASESELREVVASQKEQLSVLNDMLASLQLKSPIKGCVISWDQAETLEHRPVQIGQKLMSIAELSGQGRLQLRVLDEDTRHIINARKNNPQGLRVTFSLASDPAIRRSAMVTQLGTTVETLTDQGATLRVDAVVDAAQMVDVRPGATANAKIHCGRASIGYVWTRRLWDFISFRIF